MRYLFRFTLLLALASVPTWFLAGCGPDTSYDHAVRTNFAESALLVLDEIERAHEHQLNFGKDEPPQNAIDRLGTYAHSDAEKDVADKLGDLLIIVEANSNEYSGCDAKIKAALRSDVWPNSFYPECK